MPIKKISANESIRVLSPTMILLSLLPGTKDHKAFFVTFVVLLLPDSIVTVQVCDATKVAITATAGYKNFF
jgi:hypothetical protein